MLAGRILAVVIIVVFASSGMAQQPGEVSYRDESKMPTGEVGQLIQKIIEIVNSNDPEKIQRFLKDHCTEEFRNMAPMNEHLAVFGRFYRQTGGIKFHSIRIYEPERPNQTVVIVKDRNFESWRGISINFDDSQGQLAAGIQFSPARTPTNVTEGSLSQREMTEQVATIVRRLSELDVFSGTVLVASGDNVLYQYAGGEASKRFHVANDINTKFNLGSMNKMFTATAIAQLAERGQLTFDDPINKYVDESWLPDEITKKITIHHLLSHTSGLGSYFNDTYWQGSREQYRTVDDFKPLVTGEKLAFEPGSRFRYSNTGMLLLGVVIERATGQSYFDYIREHVYGPAGMTHSDSYEMDYPVENLAIGYIPDQNSPHGWQNNLFKHVIKGGPAGGGFSTVGDLHRFARALQTGKLVSERSLKRMWTDQSTSNYGYGFSIETGPAGIVTGHGGGFPGLNGNLDIFVDRGYIVAVLANYGGAASPVAEKIKQLVSRTVNDRSSSIPTSSKKVVDQIVQASCGECQFGMKGNGCDLAVRIDGKSYYVDGALMDDHGDAHGEDGMCNCVRRAKVTGQIKDGRFAATSFELLQFDKLQHQAAKKERLRKSRLGAAFAMSGEGLVIDELLEDGVAGKAGLRKGDRIIKLNEKTVADLDSNAIRAVLTEAETIDFSIIRDENAMDISVQVSKK
jgi:CubicO group peptidase (beta-lactamase class C family)